VLLDIDTHSGVPIFRQAVDQIRRQIMAGQLASGSQLPSVRDLAAELKVNPMTISKVYSLLETEGLLDRRRGIGLFVSPGASRKNQTIKIKILEDLLRKAAVLTTQFSIPQDEAIRLFQKIHSELLANPRRTK